jgi:hypothetical protein
MWRFITSSKKTKLGATGLAVLALSGGALAFYMMAVTGSQSGSAPLGSGSGSLDVSNMLTVTLPSGLTPGQKTGASVTLNNTTSSPITITSVTPGTITTDQAGCSPSWFAQQGNGVGLPQTIAPGATAQVYGGYTQFADSGTDQSACQTANLSESFSVTGSSH